MRFAALVLLGAALSVSAQVQYSRGQNVAPVFEGWEHNPDGTFNMVFGYLNRNYEEEVDIPIGAENTISMGGEGTSSPRTTQTGAAGLSGQVNDGSAPAAVRDGDRGQPTHFYPRRQ